MAPILAFIKLSRLKFLTGGVLGVALGTIMAHRVTGTYLWPHIVAVQAVVTAFQLMTHYSNDYFDQAADALAVRTPFSGGSGVFARKELAPPVALLAAQTCLLLGLLALSFFAAANDWLVVALGVLIAALAWSYSSPPIRLHSRGLGEFTTALIVGILVPLLAFGAAANSLSIVAFLSTLPAACAMFIMMICVEIPDIIPDSVTGKKNLVVRFGRRATPRMIALAAAGVIVSAGLAVAWGAPWTLLAVAFLALPACAVLFLRIAGLPATPVTWIARTGVAIFIGVLAGSVAAYLGAR